MCTLLEGYSTMQTDALTLAAVADELTQAALGARVEDVIQPTPQSIALLLYGQGTKRWLVISAHPQLANMHLAARRPRKMVNRAARLRDAPTQTSGGRASDCDPPAALGARGRTGLRAWGAGIGYGAGLADGGADGAAEQRHPA